MTSDEAVAAAALHALSQRGSAAEDGKMALCARPDLVPWHGCR